MDLFIESIDSSEPSIIIDDSPSDDSPIISDTPSPVLPHREDEDSDDSLGFGGRKRVKLICDCCPNCMKERLDSKNGTTVFCQKHAKVVNLCSIRLNG